MGLKKLCPSANPEGDIIALGELLVDLIPSRPDMMLSDAGKVIKTASGSAGIFACAAANFAGRSGFLGKIGKDSLSQMVSSTISHYGVDLSHTVVSDNGQIGLAFLEYREDGRNYQYYRERSVGSFYSADDVDTEYLSTGFALHFPGMLLELSDEMRSACMKAVETARSNGVLISFDPNIRKELSANTEAKERMLWAISCADIIAPTLDEAQMITGKDSVGEMLRELHKMGPKLVALTRDKDGAVLSAGGRVVMAHGIAVSAIDPTGAGDTFAAALAYAVQQNFDLEQAARFCNAAGTLTTTKRGAVGMALPSRQQVEEMASSDLCRTESLSLSEMD